MPRVTLTANPMPTPWATAPQLLTFTAADATNFEQCQMNGRQLILIWNNSATTTYNITITSVGTSLQNRSGDQTQASLAANSIYITQIFPQDGWQQSNGMIYFQATNANILFAVVTVPG